MRKHPRFDLKQPLRVVDTLSGDDMGMLVNVSQEGMMLLGDKPIVSDGVYQVSIPLKSIPKEDISLSIGVECLWTNDADIEGKNWSGFRIIDISAHEQSMLNHMIEQLGAS
jgi:hypothetical protein